MIKQLKQLAFCAAFALGIAQSASADTVVTFQVDMTTQINNSAFTPGTDQVFVRGPFNGWPGSGGLLMSNNPAAANTNLYTATVDIAANNFVEDYKYASSRSGYEGTQDGQNRCVALPATSGAHVTVDTAFFKDDSGGVFVTTPVTFQVDMAQQINLGKFIPGTTHVFAQGLYEGWTDSGAELFNDPTILRTNNSGLVTSNVYTGTFSVTSAEGGTEQYKFVISPDGNNNSYEEPTTGDPDNSQNRFFDGPTNGTPALVLPVIFFSDAAYNPIATNAVTFQVDMSLQVLNGNFDPTVSQVNVNGVFNNFTANRNVLTNNPAASNTNIYSGTVTVIDGVGATETYKFTISPLGVDDNLPSYETTANGNHNRSFMMANTNAQTLPLVFYSDSPITTEVLLSNVTVTFTVDMTNGVGTDNVAWDAVTNSTVYINGDFLGWPSFNTSLPQMTESAPGSSIYTYQTTIHAGKPVQLNYLYSLNGNADESNGQNHVRYIRAYGSYNLPTDIFGHPVVEISFGNLSIGAPSGGNAPINWLGRPGVHLQSRGSLTSGSWTDILGTDATGATSVTVGGSNQYFRLIHPPL